MLRVSHAVLAAAMLGLIGAGCVSRGEYNRVTANERHLSEELAAAKADRASARQRSDKLADQVRQLTEQLDQTKASAAEFGQKLADTQGKLADAKQKLGKADAELAAARTAQTDLATARRKVADLEKSAANTERQLALVKAKADAQANELAELHKRSAATEPVGTTHE